MASKNALNRIIGSQHDNATIKTARVPIRRDEDPHPGKLPDAKRKQLQNILNKENNKEKRERVALVLNKKFINIFGSKYESIIKFFVEDYFSTHDEDITSEDYDLLEKEIRNSIRSKIDTAAQEKLKEERARAAAQQQAIVDANKPVVKTPEPTSKVNEWQLIQAYHVVQEEEKKKRDALQLQEKKQKFKASLDAHLNIAQRQLRSDNDSDKVFASNMMKDVEAFQEEEKRKQEERRLHFQNELQMRKDQIAEQRLRVQKEKQAIRELEERNLQLAREELARESEKIKQRKEIEKEANEKIKRENEINRQLRAKEKEQEAELDHHLMVEYAAKLDRDNAAKEAAFQKRMNEMEKHALKFEKEGAGKARREEQLAFDQMLMREQAKKEIDDERKERQKIEDRRRRIQEEMTENQRQLEQKRLQMEEQRKKDEELRARYQQESEEYQRELQRKREQRLLSQAKYRQVIDSQLDELKQVDRKLVGITATEKKINMSTLREISEDPQTKSRVLHQLRIGQAYNNNNNNNGSSKGKW